MAPSRLALRALGALCFGLAAAPAPALQFEQGGFFDPSRHERFASGSAPGAGPNPGFFLAAHEAELSGVGWQSDAPWKSAPLLTRRYFLNADHYRIGGSLTFRGGDGQLHAYAVVANTRVHGDIAIGTLATPVAPEHAIQTLPVLPVEGTEHDGREVLYFGGAPGSGRPAAGRTAIEYSSGSTSRLNSALVAAELALDRVAGVPGDSGSPSFVSEGGALAVVGHHVGGLNDQYLGTRAARDAVDDFLAAQGASALLEVLGEGRLGDPAQGGVVVTRLSAEAALALEAAALGQPVARTIRFHDLSRRGAQVALRVEGAAFTLRPPGGALLRELVLALPSSGAGAPLEVVFTAPEWGSQAGRLLLDESSGGREIALAGTALDAGLRPVEIGLEPLSQSGSAGSGELAGETRVFTLVATNRDEGDLSPAALELAGRGPAGWQVAVDAPTLSLARGETATASLLATPPPDAPLGTYALAIDARDAEEPAHDASATAVYEVTGHLMDVAPPTAPSGLAASGNRKRTQLSWNAAVDDVGVAEYEVLRDDAPIGHTAGTSFTDAGFEPDRVYGYRVRAYDAAGNASPPSDALLVMNGRPFSGGASSGGDPGAAACKPTRAKEVGRSCRDGADNDCDGAMDAADPDC
jgi:chitodextrinase